MLITVVPPNTADLRTDSKKRRYSESYITKKNPVWELKRGGGIGMGGGGGGGEQRAPGGIGVSVSVWPGS